MKFCAIRICERNRDEPELSTILRESLECLKFLAYGGRRYVFAFETTDNQHSRR